MSYNGISQHVVSLFTSLCKLHQQQSRITSHCKKTISTPIQASGFLCHVKIDLIDFREFPYYCSKHHNWVLHAQNHFSKYSWLLPLKHRETQEVASSLQSLFWMFGFPTTLHSDNGKEFKSKLMTDFVQNTKSSKYLVHQEIHPPKGLWNGLIEQAKRTFLIELKNLACHQTNGV